MKKICFPLLLVFISFPVVLSAQSSYAEASEELVELMQSKQSFVDAFVPVFGTQIQDGLAAQGVPQEKIDRIKQAGLKLAENIVNDPAYIQALTDLYMEAFSESEIHDLIAFYKTEIGQKLIKQLPLLTAQGATIGESLTNKHMAPFQAEMQAILEE